MKNQTEIVHSALALSYRGQIKRFFQSNMEIFLFVLVLLYKCLIFNGIISLRYNYFMFLLACLGPILVLAGISMLFKRTSRIIFLLVADIVVTIILVADVIFYSYFNDVISAPVLMQLTLVDSLEKSIVNLFRPVLLLFLADLAFFIPYVVHAIRRKKVVNVQSMKQRVTGAVAILLAAVCLMSFGFLNIKKVTGRAMNLSIRDHTLVVKYAGILNFHAGDVYFFAVEKLFGAAGLPESEKSAIKTVFSESPLDDSGSKLYEGAGEGKNLIVVQVEALQNIMINMEVNGQEVTPNLNKFIKRSMYFNNYYSQVAAGGTSDAEFLSNNSYYPLAEGAVYYQYGTNNTFDSLPINMKKNGYTTEVMHAYKANFWNREAVYPVLGFDRFLSEKYWNIDETLAWGLTDKSFLKQAAAEMQKEKGPFYSFLITLSSHYPFDAFEEYGNFDAGEFNGTFFGNYVKAMHYADEALGEFIDNLEKSGLLDNSVLAIYGDHAGIQKKELEDIKDFLKLCDNEDVGLVHMKEVPLIIHLPEDEGAGLYEKVGGQVDLYPTLANIMGIDTKYSLGKNLLSEEGGYAIFRDGSITDGETVYIKRNDESFELSSGIPVEKEQFEDMIEKASEQLYISDSVIKNNLIPYFEKHPDK